MVTAMEHLKNCYQITLKIVEEVFANKQLFSTVKHVIINLTLTLFLWDFVYDKKSDNRFYGQFFLDQNSNYSTGDDILDGFVNGFTTVAFLAIVSFIMLGIALLDFQRIVKLWLHASSLLILYVISGITFYDAVRKVDQTFDLQKSQVILDFVTGFMTTMYGTIGIYAFFFNGPLFLHQTYVITNCSFVAVFYLRAFPNHTAWFVLWSVVAWDMFAVLAPIGPLRRIQEKAADYNSNVLKFLMFSAQEEEKNEESEAESEEEEELEDESEKRLIAGVDKSKFPGKNVKNLIRYFVDRQKRLDEKIAKKLVQEESEKEQEQLEESRVLAEIKMVEEGDDDDVEDVEKTRKIVSNEELIAEKIRERRRSIHGSSSSDEEKEVDNEEEDEEVEEAKNLKTANSISNEKEEEEEDVDTNKSSSVNSASEDSFSEEEDDSDTSLELDQLLEMKQVLEGHKALKRKSKKKEKVSAADALNGDAMRLGMGDFVFYSVLVGKAACYGSLLTTAYTAIGVVFGLIMTLTVLSSSDETTPALPMPIAVGTVFYFYSFLVSWIYNSAVSTLTNVVDPSRTEL